MTRRELSSLRIKRQNSVKLPPLPATAFHPLGPIPVTLVDDLRAPDDPNERLYGYWNAFARTISIRRDLHPVQAWCTFYHELTHAWLSDIGVKLPEEHEEAICEAIARARVAELIGESKR